ncbi:transposase [Streptomyces sp. M1013]|uniref:transposase n=1 Tax=Streptomyces sp. M1013 TaxID=549798 RepID=UPI000D1A3DFA|nr:transposase [Streptomyces sp. M1013]
MSERKPYKTDVSEEPWALVEPVSAAWKAAHPSVSGHKDRYAIREIVNALLYEGLTGCQWELLPYDFPSPGAVKYHFCTWHDDGIDQTIHDLLRWQVREMARRKAAPAPQFGVSGVLGDDRGDTGPADRGDRASLANRVTGGELTLGAVLARLEWREREITAQAETTRGQIMQQTAQPDELGRAAEEVRITRKTLLALPDQQPPAPPAPELPDHPAYQLVMAVFTEADHPLRARQVCEAMDVAVAPNNMNNVHLKLKRLAGGPRDPGRDRARLFTQPRRCRTDIACLPACPLGTTVNP